MINESFDKLVAAAKLPRHTQRKAALVRYNKYLIQKRSDLLDNSKTWKKLLFGGEKGRSFATEAMGNIFVTLFAPAAMQSLYSEERSAARLDLARISVALERYRKANGRYPAKLSDLQPKFLKKLPVDFYSEKPYIYKPSKTGYMLYSVGPNQKDDDGRTFSSETDDDDILLKMERPQ